MNVGTRKRLWGLTALLAAALVFVVACGDDEEAGGDATSSPGAASPTDAATFKFDCQAAHPGTAPDAADFPVEVTDDAGTAITLDAPPEAIASLSAGHTEMLYAIGAGDQVAAVDNTSDCPLAAAELEQVDAFSPSVEVITALAPDLVIIFYDPGDLATSLASAGVPTITLNSPESVEGVYDQIELLGLVTGHVAESEALTVEMAAAVTAITDGLDPAEQGPSVFHEVDINFYTAGSGSFIGDLYDLLNAENIADATGEAYPQMSQEAIIEAAPEVIILADEQAGESPATVKARPGWDAIPAVKNDRIHAVDPDIASRPGPRLVEALRVLAKFLYPEEDADAPSGSGETEAPATPYQY